MTRDFTLEGDQNSQEFVDHTSFASFTLRPTNFFYFDPSVAPWLCGVLLDVRYQAQNSFQIFFLLNAFPKMSAKVSISANMYVLSDVIIIVLQLKFKKAILFLFFFAKPLNLTQSQTYRKNTCSFGVDNANDFVRM